MFSGRLKILLRSSQAPRRTRFPSKSYFYGSKTSVCGKVKRCCRKNFFPAEKSLFKRKTCCSFRYFLVHSSAWFGHHALICRAPYLYKVQQVLLRSTSKANYEPLVRVRKAKLDNILQFSYPESASSTFFWLSR